MMESMPDWPVDSLRQPLLKTLAECGRAVVQAPPGAGKSTRLPLWLLEGAAPDLRILLLQPRRLAALHVARRLADSLGEELGRQVGVTTRFDRQVSNQTRLEVLTEGVFLRRIQSDPLLESIGWVLFDEVHERSWQCDLALGFALEAQDARDTPSDLGLVAMSATLDGQVWADWFKAPLLACAGRQFPVSIHYSPVGRNPWQTHAAAEVEQLLLGGSRRVLVFLPGMRWIRDLEQALRQRNPGLPVWPLHASLPLVDQARALSPPQQPDVVLATNVAQTSLTIAGVDAVVDTGLARNSRFNPQRGLDELVLAAIAQDAAEQRSGRAGRLAPGRSVRLWDREQHGRRPVAETPEIQRVDLAPLAMELAAWGDADAGSTRLFDRPDPARLQAARNLLLELGAVDARGTLTVAGRRMAGLGVHPRLARLILEGETQGALVEACLIAALLAEGAQPAGRAIDLRDHWQVLARESKSQKKLWQVARQLVRRAGGAWREPRLQVDLETLLIPAYGDRLARQRQSDAKRFLLGRGGETRLADGALLGQCWLLVLNTVAVANQDQLALVVPVSESSAENYLAGHAVVVDEPGWDERRDAPVTLRRRRYGALVLDESVIPAQGENLAAALRERLQQRGLRELAWSEPVERWLSRVRWLAPRMQGWPDFSDEFLLASLDQWLLGWLSGARGLADLRRLDHRELLMAHLGYERSRELDRLAPSTWTLPTGQRQPLEYRSESGPRLSARPQQLYGLDIHPLIGPDREPLVIELLSPARRPIQITADLPGFWRGAWKEVSKEMRGRYPKHHWPDQPWLAEPRVGVRH